MREGQGGGDGGPQNPPGKKEILYKGFYYDITSFYQRHPGGQLIEMYLNNSEDASQAIDQFHNRAEKRVQGILNSFPKREAKEEELIAAYGETKLSRHRALTRDFEALFKELKDEGLFEPSIPHVFLRWLELTTFGSTGLFLFFQGGALSLLGILLFWIACGRSGWFVHEGGHHSFTGRPGLDRWLQSHVYGIYCGLSGACWRNHHNKHHAMPQHLHNDIDLQTLPILAFHKKVVKNCRKEFNFLVKYQKWLIYVVQSSIIGFYWKYVEDPIFAYQNGFYWDLFHMALHQLFIPLIGFPLYFLSGCVVISYLVLNSSLSHSHLPITEESTHWVEYGLTHTANVKSSWFVDYFMGYLNFQIEHHLFPTMPQFRNKLASSRVKALAEKHGLPYHVYDYMTILKMTLDNLGKVSEELTEETKSEEEAAKLEESIEKEVIEDKKVAIKKPKTNMDKFLLPVDEKMGEIRHRFLMQNQIFNEIPIYVR